MSPPPPMYSEDLIKHRRTMIDMSKFLLIISLDDENDDMRIILDICIAHIDENLNYL